MITNNKFVLIKVFIALVTLLGPWIIDKALRDNFRCLVASNKKQIWQEWQEVKR